MRRKGRLLGWSPLRALLIGALIVSVPVYTHATLPAAAQRSLADKLREGPGLSNHPVRVVPSASMRLPDDWPLNPDGTLGCTTCHQELPALDGTTGPKLRGVTGDQVDSRTFCTNCHTDSGPATAATMHWMAAGRAHSGGTDDSARRSSGLLDSASIQCMSCHDGVSASEAANTTAWNRGPGGRGDHRRNHPVGVPYLANGAVGSAGPLKTASSLPAEIRLPAGKVSCVSCHNIYGKDANRLTVPIEDSALCFTCHDMD